MTPSWFDGEVDLGPDDEFLIGDCVRRGDVAYFNRGDDYEALMRTLAEADRALKFTHLR